MDDYDFDYNDYFDFEHQDEFDSYESEIEWQAEKERVRNLPIVKKAVELFETANAIIGTMNEVTNVLDVRELMMENALTIPLKIYGAERGNFYILRMENAVIIKIAARELLSQTLHCKTEGLSKSEYLDLLINEIEEFRLLFIEWVNSFDKSDNIPDNWGLFY